LDYVRQWENWLPEVSNNVPPDAPLYADFPNPALKQQRRPIFNSDESHIVEALMTQQQPLLPSLFRILNLSRAEAASTLQNALSNSEQIERYMSWSFAHYKTLYLGPNVIGAVQQPQLRLSSMPPSGDTSSPLGLGYIQIDLFFNSIVLQNILTIDDRSVVDALKGLGFLPGILAEDRNAAKDSQKRVQTAVVAYDVYTANYVRATAPELLQHVLWLRSLLNHDATSHLLVHLKSIDDAIQPNAAWDFLSADNDVQAGEGIGVYEHWSAAFHNTLIYDMIEHDITFRKQLFWHIEACFSELVTLKERVRQVLLQHQKAYKSEVDPAFVVNENAIAEMAHKTFLYWLYEVESQLSLLLWPWDYLGDSHSDYPFIEAIPSRYRYTRAVAELAHGLLAPFRDVFDLRLRAFHREVARMTRSNSVYISTKLCPLSDAVFWFLDELQTRGIWSPAR